MDFVSECVTILVNPSAHSARKKEKCMNKNKQKLTGTMGLEHTLHENRGKTRYDEAGKKILSYKEVLANILKYSVPEYEAYTREEIMSFIDTDSISNERPLEPDTDTRIHGDNTEQSSIQDATLSFDVFFRVIQPTKNNVHLHVDVELQGDYYPGYPIEKRGIYHLSRMVSSQLDVINKKTNYDRLQKSYSIFICVGNVPQKLWNTISYYQFVNTKTVGKVDIPVEKYDLMELVVIRIGEEITSGVEDIIHFLHGIFYEPSEVEEYIDFSKNEEFRKELAAMAITGEHLIQYGKGKEHAKTLAALKRAEKAERKLKEIEQKAEQEKQQAQKEKQRAEEARLAEQQKNKELEAKIRELESRLK